MAEPDKPQLCLSCARARLAKKAAKPCADCIRLNIDPLAQVRANSAKPNPLAKFSFSDTARSTWRLGSVVDGTGQKPAHKTYGGGD
jgi:hypothetical protein